MAVISITIPDPVATEVVDALCQVGDWRSIALDGAKDAFAKTVLIRYLKTVTINNRARIAAATASTAATTQATTDLSGVT